MFLPLIERAVMALALGLLVGAERERVQSKKRFQQFAGIRTFACISMFGFMSAYLGDLVHWSMTICVMVLFMGFVVMLYMTRTSDNKHIGFTTELAAIITYLTGVIMFYDIYFAVFTGVVLSTLLALKETIHRIVNIISDKEFYAILQFVIISFVVLPILPTEAVDPWGVIVPYKVWFTVVTISAIGFVGYFLSKQMGVAKSSRYVGIFGGLASSTAVNVTFAQESKQATDKGMIATLVSSALLSISSSFIRILFFIGVINMQLFRVVLPYIATAMIGFYMLSIIFHFFHGNKRFKPKALRMNNPLHLKGALEFGMFLIAILVLSTVAQQAFGVSGIYITSFLSGLAKGDAIAVALATMTAEGVVSYDTATIGMMISIAASLLSKGGIGYLFGEAAYARYLSIAFILPFVALVGTVVFLVMM